MGWINYKGEPKVPFWVFAMYANHHGDQRLSAQVNSPVYNAKSIGIMQSQSNVPEVTVLASRDEKTKRVYINFVNRSLTTAYPIQLDLKNGHLRSTGTLYRLAAKELTAHNGRDMPPEWPYKKEYEPYSTAQNNSIKIKKSSWNSKQLLKIAPFSMMTLVLDTRQ